MVNNNVGSKTTANRKVWECTFQIIFNCTNSQTAAVIVACTKTQYQQFLFTDFILIADIIQGCVTGIIIFFFVHSFLLRSFFSSFCFCCFICNSCFSSSCCFCCRTAGTVIAAGASRQHCSGHCQRKHKNSYFFHHIFSF